MPKAFSISFQNGALGRGFEVSSERNCAGYAGNFAISSASLKRDLRVGGLPRKAERFICSALVAQRRKSNAASLFFASRGIAISQLPISARPGFFAPGIVVNSILPITFDLAGSLNEEIHAGQLIEIAAVPCNRCAPTSSALKLAYPGGEYLPSSSMNFSAAIPSALLTVGRPLASNISPPKAQKIGMKSATAALPCAARIT